MDILIRDLPEDVVAAIDADAQRQGISRSEYLRRQIIRVSQPEVTLDDLRWLREVCSEALEDPDFKKKAWGQE